MCRFIGGTVIQKNCWTHYFVNVIDKNNMYLHARARALRRTAVNPTTVVGIKPTACEVAWCRRLSSCDLCKGREQEKKEKKKNCCSFVLLFCWNMIFSIGWLVHYLSQPNIQIRWMHRKSSCFFVLLQCCVVQLIRR